MVCYEFCMCVFLLFCVGQEKGLKSHIQGMASSLELLTDLSQYTRSYINNWHL